MTPQTEQEIEKLRTLNDNYTALVDIFDHLVPREYVVLTLSAPSDVDWTMYSVVVTNNDKGTSDTYVIPSNGVVEFEVKYDTTYTIKLPILGDFIAPKDLTFTAGLKMREVGYSYRMAGVFGIDASGKYYSIAQIEALEDKSIIKYGGYTDEYLENYKKADGTYGCGFMWNINIESLTGKWASANVEFDQELLPFITTNEVGLLYCDGEAYTQYIISEGKRLGVDTPVASACVSSSILVGAVNHYGFLLSTGQTLRAYNNLSLIKGLYTAFGMDNPLKMDGQRYTSAQYSSTDATTVASGQISTYAKTTGWINYDIFYPLP